MASAIELGRINGNRQVAAIGRQLKAAREATGMSVSECSDAIVAGATWVEQIEAGNGPFMLWTYCQLAASIGKRLVITLEDESA